jgi:hypothetical protein
MTPEQEPGELDRMREIARRAHEASPGVEAALP